MSLASICDLVSHCTMISSFASGTGAAAQNHLATGAQNHLAGASCDALALSSSTFAAAALSIEMLAQNHALTPRLLTV
jgi:hypothetical protein